MQDEDILIKNLFEKLEIGKLTVSIAESCTGGMICDFITNVAGSSRYFLGGVVSYSNESKINVLGVEEDSIIKHGAVSEKVASQMAEGVKRIMNTDIGISTTGIAGPDGGTDEKPVGLCYIGISIGNSTEVRKFIFEGNRVMIKRNASKKAIEILMSKLT